MPHERSAPHPSAVARRPAVRAEPVEPTVRAGEAHIQRQSSYLSTVQTDSPSASRYTDTSSSAEAEGKRRRWVVIPLLTVALAMSLILGFSITKPKRPVRITFRIGTPPGGAR